MFVSRNYAGSKRAVDLESLLKWQIKPRLEKKKLIWHGWHAFRRGLATNLHALGVDGKTIQAILRHSNVGLTMNVYVKTVSESQVSAMDSLSEKFGICNDLATTRNGLVN